MGVLVIICQGDGLPPFFHGCNLPFLMGCSLGCPIFDGLPSFDGSIDN